MRTAAKYACLTLLLLSCGCYSRVVDAEGIGSESVDTEDANRPQEPDLELNRSEHPR